MENVSFSIAFLVQVTGFPPVAALADKQSTGLFGPTDKLLCNFLPISNPVAGTRAKEDATLRYVFFVLYPHPKHKIFGL